MMNRENTTYYVSVTHKGRGTMKFIFTPHDMEYYRLADLIYFLGSSSDVTIRVCTSDEE